MLTTPHGCNNLRSTPFVTKILRKKFPPSSTKQRILPVGVHHVLSVPKMASAAGAKEIGPHVPSAEHAGRENSFGPGC
jgi:hypothetical protein